MRLLTVHGSGGGPQADHDRRQLSEREARVAARERLLIGREADLETRERALATREHALQTAGGGSAQGAWSRGATERRADVTPQRAHLRFLLGRACWIC